LPARAPVYHLLTQAEQAKDEGAYLRIPGLFSEACTINDHDHVVQLFVEKGIPYSALQYPNAS
jgi:hypothetical protein